MGQARPAATNTDPATRMTQPDNVGVRCGNAINFFECWLLCKRNASAQAEVIAFSELAGDLVDQQSMHT